ncbi:MAG: 50S ribosomal protein L11 [Candidatus Thermoplasmatota archaeon]|nr:50S ribosomal protein L11 [Candidatus Thermoplasmatota archaeon]MCL5731316.1 50S ribosomal protein L11 [Candidatus Thermoplasmatota archaeon]
MPQTVNTMVEGGKATTGPPLGPALGPLGLNLGQLIKEINEKTKEFAGMQVPISVIVVDPASKKYEIKVGIPPTSALLKKELGIETASGNKKEKIAGNATMEMIKKVARSKSANMLSYDLRGAVLEVLGTCVSMGINVEGKDPKEIQKLIISGSMEI